MIAGIFEFGDTTVKEVMVPRIDMACAEISSKPEDILALIQQKRHSRIPIYRERVDHIEGVVYAKDLLELLSTGQAWTPEGAMRQPYFVPEDKKIDELLREFKTNKVHMAIVINEFGGTSGLVTLEDLIEEIVGEIHDEYDEEEELFHWDEGGQVLVADARLDIAGPQSDTEYRTATGWLRKRWAASFTTTWAMSRGRRRRLSFENLTLWVEEVVGQRITTVSDRQTGT